MGFLIWLTRLLISVAAGAGAWAVTYGALAIMSSRSRFMDDERYSRQEYGEVFLSVGIGAFMFAFVFWLLSRKTFASRLRAN